MQIFDISLPISSLTVTKPEDPRVEFSNYKTYEDDEKKATVIKMSLQTATHVITPNFLLKEGSDISKFEISNFFGAATLLDFSNKEQKIRLEDLESKSELISEHDIVLLKTKNSSNMLTEFKSDYISLSSEGTDFLTSINIKTLGIDGPSVDEFHAEQLVSLKKLFSQNILVYLNLFFANVPEGRYLFYGFPLKLENTEAAPVRAVLNTG